MHSITLGLLLPALLLLSPALAQIPSNKILHSYPTAPYPTGTAPYYPPYPTGTGYHHPHGTGPLSYGSGPSEAGSTCALPTTVTTTTQITVTVTVPVDGGSPTTIPTTIGTGIIGTGTGTGTGIVGPTASAGLVRRRGLEMRGLGEEKMRLGRKRCFPELGDLPHTCPTKGVGNGPLPQ